MANSDFLPPHERPGYQKCFPVRPTPLGLPARQSWRDEMTYTHGWTLDDPDDGEFEGWAIFITNAQAIAHDDPDIVPRLMIEVPWRPE